MRKKVLAGLIVIMSLTAVGALISTGRSSASARWARRVPKRTTVPQSQTVSRTLISGRVLDPEGNPVAGAEVMAFGDKYHIGKIPSAVTNEHGEFVIEGVRPGGYDISASKEEEGYGDTRSGLYSADAFRNPRAVVSLGQEVSDVVVQLGPKCTRLVVHVSDRQMGKKLGAGPNMQIKLRRDDRPGVSVATGTDENGDFSILIPPAAYSLEISIPGYKKQQYRGAGAEPAAKTNHASPPRRKEIALSLDREQ